MRSRYFPSYFTGISKLSNKALLLTIVKNLAEIGNSEPYPKQNIEKIYAYRNDVLHRDYSRIFAEELNRWHNSKEEATPFLKPDEAPIWMCWLNGGRNGVPRELEKTIQSVEHNREKHELCFLDYAEAAKLVEIPDILLTAFADGRLKPAHLTDYIRAALLSKYGGIWLDCSILMTRPLSDSIVEIPFWSVKDIESYPFDIAVPFAHEWQIYAMAGQPGALFYKIFTDLFAYGLEYFGLIPDYFYSYHIAKLIRDNVPAVSKSYNMIPPNNQMCEQLMPYLQKYEPIHKLGINRLTTDSTCLYKLSRHVICDNTPELDTLYEQLKKSAVASKQRLNNE